MENIKKAVVCGALLVVAVISSGWTLRETSCTEHVYIVKSGDTLWDIAERNCGRVYILAYIEELKDRNPGLRENHGQIRPGDELIVHREAE